ncbi:DUF2865 domain-containing protein [Amorphus sp. 3PC139-8]|uniref:DUF2865 domain-containing protein n=1 Tax=Amorphus sp. 3PC139-8 TaxID=2735676 RepID=UPI00345E02A9
MTLPSAPRRTALLVGLFALAIMMIVGTGSASAQSCAAMRSELSRLNSAGSATAEIASLERRANANGCRNATSWGRPQVCAGIDAQISSLKRSGGSANPARARQLQRAIARNCSDPEPQRQANTRRSRQEQSQPSQARSQPARNTGITTHGSVIIHGTRPDNFIGAEARETPGFFARLFGGGQRASRFREDGRHVETPDAQREKAPADSNRARLDRSGTSEGDGIVGVYRGGGMKTWCVRLCDGFYFPVSYSTSSSNYRRDLAICQGRCPGADVSLYSHPSYLDPEDMVSTVSGERYTALPTAFLYRDKVISGCGCELQAPEIKTAGDRGLTTPLDAAPQDEASELASTETGEDGVETPVEAGDAEQGSLTVAAYAQEVAEDSPASAVLKELPLRPKSDDDSDAREITEDDLNVRKVGPTFFADQIAASAAEAQARTSGQ